MTKINYFQLLSWIDSLDESWDEWRVSFYFMPQKMINEFWQAVEEANVTTFEQFKEYMEI